MTLPRRRLFFLANVAVAAACVLAFKLSLFVDTTIGSDGSEVGRLKTWSKLFLCLGWDVLGAFLVGGLAVLVAALASAPARRPAAALSAAAAVHTLHALFLVISFQVTRVVGAPLDKAAIDLVFFNTDTHAGASSLSIASSVGAYATLPLLACLALALVLPSPALLFTLRRAATWQRVWPVLAAAGMLFTITAILLPAMRDRGVRVHTFGLERSPVTLLLGSYLRAPLRSVAASEPPPADPFCLDLSDPFGPKTEPENLFRAARPARTNVLLVLLESIGTRNLEDPSVMPFLHELGARDGAVVLSQHYSHWPQTMKSFFSIYCSELPDPDYTPISYSNPAIPCISLPEALKAEGYDTALFTSADFAYERKLRFLKHRRFDRLVDRPDMPGRHGAWENTWGIDEAVTVRAVLDWMSSRRSSSRPAAPFFAVYSMVVGHHPYDYPGAPSDEAEAERGAFRYADDRLAEVFRGLEAAGILDDTVVLVVSDHGPGSGRPGMGQVRDASIYEGSMRVPAVVVAPQLAGTHGTIPFATSHIDLAPTILGLLGIAPPITMKGRNLVAESDARLVIMATRPPLSQIGVRAGRWKLVHSEETGMSELFDLAADPEERHDLAPAHPDIVTTLEDVVGRWKVHAQNLIENYAAILPVAGRRCAPPVPAVPAAPAAPPVTSPLTAPSY